MTKHDADFESELQDVDPRNGQRRAEPAQPSWLSRNWAPSAMLIVTIGSQFFNGGGWSHDRTNAEQALQTSIEGLRTELRRDEATFVRQDVFNQVMLRIDKQLSDIADGQRRR